MLLAQLRAACHSIRHGLSGHRIETISIKVRGDWFSHVVAVSCECGKTFDERDAPT